MKLRMHYPRQLQGTSWVALLECVEKILHNHLKGISCERTNMAAKLTIIDLDEVVHYVFLFFSKNLFEYDMYIFFKKQFFEFSSNYFFSCLAFLGQTGHLRLIVCYYFDSNILIIFFFGRKFKKITIRAYTTKKKNKM